MPHTLAILIALAAGISHSLAAPAVVVVEGDFLGQGADYMRAEMDKHTRTMHAVLDAARVGHRATKDSLVEKHGLPPAAVAILPYNRAISAAELRTLLAFIQAGGKVIACFLAPPELLDAIGARGGEIISESFSGFDTEGATPTGLPKRVAQPSRKVRVCSPRPGAQVIAYWRSLDGERTNRPAVILSDKGAFISHVLLEEGDRQAQAALMRALCGHLAPQVWADSIALSPEDIQPLGNYQSLAQMREKLLERERAGEDVSRALGAVREVVDRMSAARGALGAGRVDEATAMAAQIEALAHRAYWMSYPSRNGELRGVWACNNAPGDWETAIRSLRDANLNAVFPYVCSAGVAWYRSEFLPRASDKDYLTRATRAGRRYGVPIHARMLNLYAMCAPASFKTKLREQGRLMVSASGKTTNWLCPVNPKNRRLQCRLAAEMVGKYPVTGIQLDYMRYPSLDSCFCPTCRRAFAEHIGRELDDMPRAVKSGALREVFLDWRRAQLTSLVREIREAMLAEREDAIISAAVFLNWEGHRDTFGQDWKVWVDRGLVDFVCPMSYTPSNEKFTQYTKRQIGWVDGRVPLCPGIGVNADNMDFGGPQNLLDQITIARNLKTDGWTIFNLDERLITDYLPYLKLGATSTPSSFNPFRPIFAPVSG